MFPDYDKNTLNIVLRENGKFYKQYCYYTLFQNYAFILKNRNFIDNRLNATIDYMLQLDESEQAELKMQK